MRMRTVTIWLPALVSMEVGDTATETSCGPEASLKQELIVSPVAWVQ
jgi:hypothetical protein